MPHRYRGIGNGNGVPPQMEPHYAVLQERVHGLEQGVRSMENAVNDRLAAVSSQISSLSAKLEERAKIPWPALGVMLSFLTIIGGLVWWPVKDQQARQVDLLDRLANVSVTKTENDLRFTISAQRRDDLQRLTDSRVDRIERDVADMDKRIVPRGEHAEGWASQRQRDADLQRQIEELRRGFGDLYSPKDALTRMQQRLDELERMVRPRSSGAISG